MQKISYQLIAPNTYWIGHHDENNFLDCNTYLIIDNDEAVLIEPGSVIDFPKFYSVLTTLVPLEKIKYIILGHQDPDVCSNVPLLEQKGFVGKIVSHWRTINFVKYYGITSSFIAINEQKYQLTLKSGRILKFINTPYLHFPGAIATLDEKNDILFSSDLFSAFSYNSEIYADKDYLEKMLTFHEHYMPSNDVLRPVMDVISSMNISMIAPQHGSIIKHNIPKYINALRDLECGEYIKPIKKALTDKHNYQDICNQFLKRYFAIFKEADIEEVFKDSKIKVNTKSHYIVDYQLPREELLDKFFEQIYTKKGISWITVIEPFIVKVCQEYGIPLPTIISSILQVKEKSNADLSNENQILKDINNKLEHDISETKERVLRCPITNLFNEIFYKNYFEDQLKNYPLESESDFSILFISIDNLSDINYKYGNDIKNETMQNLAYLLNELKENNHLIFKIYETYFTYYVNNSTEEDSLKLADKIKNAVKSSDFFVEPITVSLGLVRYSEVKKYFLAKQDIFSRMNNIARTRLKIATSRGTNSVVTESKLHTIMDTRGKVLVVDNDLFNAQLIKTALERHDYEVIITDDPAKAIDIAKTDLPNFIISEIMLPKFDGFKIMDTIEKDSLTKHIPFILMSHKKDDEFVARAFKFNILYYFKKPFMLSELTALLDNKIKRSPTTWK
jgi:two-component system cell cycle response regulator